jgi:DNA mismatch repair ATPase MutS
MMQQYLDIKAQNPDSILFFRLGDFYEMFNEDAKLVSKELDLTLTTRDRNKPPEERTPMCGVPYHSCDGYIQRLIAKGYKVAICEQTEDPAQAKGLVDRDIIRVVTPGTVIASSMLEDSKNNYICSVCAGPAAYGLCLCDISTGEVYAAAFPTGEEGLGHLKNELGRFHPAEAVLSSGAWNTTGLASFLKDRLGCLCENGGEARFRLDAARPLVEKQFKTCGIPAQSETAVQAAGGLLAYLYETQKTDLSHISTLTYYTAGQFMELDLTARQTLELTSTMRGKEKKGSLLWVLDKTKTAMGGRLLRGWMERPLLSPARIARRQQGVSNLVEDAITREELSLALREVTDLERLAGRVVYGSAGARDLAALAAGLGKLPRIRGLLEHVSSPLLQELHSHQGADAVGGGEKAGEHPLHAPHRQGQGVQPQRGGRRQVPDPPDAQEGRKVPEEYPHGRRAHQTVPGTPGEYRPDPLQPLPAQLLGGQVHRAGADARRAQGEKQARHRQYQLQKADPSRAGAAGEVHLKAHAHQPQKQVGPGEHDGPVEHGVAALQIPTPLVFYYYMGKWGAT